MKLSLVPRNSETNSNKFPSVIPYENFATSSFAAAAATYHHSLYLKIFSAEVYRSDYLFLYFFYHLNYVLFITFFNV